MGSRGSSQMQQNRVEEAGSGSESDQASAECEARMVVERRIE